MRKELLSFAVLSVLVMGVVFMSGCVSDQLSDDDSSRTSDEIRDEGKLPSIASMKTCSELNGYECEVGEDCSGEWLDASDSFTCCSVECTPAPGGAGALTIDPFEGSPEDEDLGDIV